jgi:hypothetical protein
MNPQALTDTHTMADRRSDLYQTWNRTLFSSWPLADTAAPTRADRSLLAAPGAGFYPWPAAWDYWVDAWQRMVCSGMCFGTAVSSSPR